MRFRITQDFWCQELKSQYTAGLDYTVKAGNGRLEKLAKEWIRQGLAVKVVDNVAVVQGKDWGPIRRTVERIKQWL